MDGAHRVRRSCESSAVTAPEVLGRQVRGCATNIHDVHIEFTAWLKIVMLLSFACRRHDLPCGTSPRAPSGWTATLEAPALGTHAHGQPSEPIVFATGL